MKRKPIFKFSFILLLTLTEIITPVRFPLKPNERLIKSKGRRSGILMHITSLPSNYGIGTLGIEAYKFVDFLVKAKQKEWQMLPIGPTGFGDSPYQSFSSFAGNHYLIDLDFLIHEGLLDENDVESENWYYDPRYVDFAQLYVSRDKVLRKAFSRFKENEASINFHISQQSWLDDYSLFMALKKHFNEKPWTEWPKEIKLRESGAINKYKKELAKEIEYQKFLQFKFNEQFKKLREYTHSKGITIIGDLPIYVPLDSADTWANPSLFQLDESGNPLFVAGVPPDAFTADGQLWGNPLYNWNRMEQDDFAWWIRRLRATGEKFDTIRIDHFRGLESYYAVPFGEKTARYGKWVKGPDEAFIDALHEQLPDINFIAEDLGYLTKEVLHLREYSGYPGMKLLQFAFDSREASDYLPFSYPKNSVCYIGTHDNDSIEGWQKSLSPEDRELAEKFLNVEPGGDLRIPILRAGFASVSDLFVGTMQDFLGLDSDSRMNRPGINDGKNWIWRALPGEITDKVAKEIEELTILFGRAKPDVRVPVLVGDVGGTNSRLRLAIISSIPDDQPQLIDVKKLHSFDFESVEDLIGKYLEPYKGTHEYPKFAVFGVPGPIKDNTVLKFTNVAHWPSVKGNDLAKKFKIEKVIFLNDFSANGYGIQTKLLKEQDYSIINDVPVDPNGVKVTFGPGTGLGMGFLTKKPEEKYYLVNPSEGGHYDFPSRNERQFKYMKFLEQYYNIDHVSVERGTCGQAIVPIYKFLLEELEIEKNTDLSKKIMEYQGTENSIEQISLNTEILKHGISGECKLCHESLKFFIELYGAAAGNIALVTIPTGGIYLLGGISIVLENMIKNSDIFMKAFIDKGRFKDVLKKIPIFLIKTDDLGTRGCVEYARRLLEDTLVNSEKNEEK